MDSSHPRWLKSAAWCALAYIAAFFVVASVLRSSFGFPLDDSWIHEVVARNLAQYHVLGFTPDTLSSGSTSLLWTLILALRPVMFAGLSPVIYSLAISVVLLGAIGFGLRYITERDGLTGAAAWCLALGPAASGNFLWFGLIGMEHLLFIAFSILVVILWFEERTSATSFQWLLPCVCFLLALTRPEGIVILALLWLTRVSAGRSRGQWTGAAAGAACGAIASAAVNWVISRRLTPLTMQGRGGLVWSGQWLSDRLDFLGHTAARLLIVWNIYAPQVLLHGRGLFLGIPLIMLIGVLLLLAVRRLRQLRASRYLLLCAWAVVLEVLYLLVLPSTGHGGRYISLVVMMFLPLLFLGLHEAFVLLLKNDSVAWTVVGTFAAVTAVLSLSTWRGAARADITQINSEHGAMAAWIEQNLPSSTIAGREIAVYDIGRIGYALHGNLVDLGGLVDPKFRPYLVAGRTAEYLEQRGVQYVVLPTNPQASDAGYATSLSLDPQHGAILSPIYTVCSNPGVARKAFTSSETAAPCQRIYRIQYGAAPTSGD